MDCSKLNRPRVKAASLPGSVPHVPVFDGEDSLDVERVAASFLMGFQSVVTKRKWERFSDLWAPDAFWKDSLTLTFDKRTLYGRESITAAWKELSTKRPVSNFSTSLEEVYGMQASFVRLAPGLASLDVPFAFTTANPSTRCVAVAKLIPQGSDWKIWILTTGAHELEEFPFQALPRNVQTVLDSAQCGKPFAQGLPKIQPDQVLDAVVIGGSAAGIGNTVMLQSAGANCAVLDMELLPGGLWSTNRYESFRLHHSKFMSQLPMLFPSADLDEYMTGKQLTSYMSNIVEQLKLPFFGGIEVLRNEWDDATKLWTIHIKDIRTGAESALQAKNIVMSNGFLIGNATPRIPQLRNRATFSGPIEHSSEYRNAKPYTNKTVVIVGAGNSAHDIAEDLVRSGAATSVTILQKSPIVFLHFDTIMAVISMLYQGQMPIEAADFLSQSLPTAIQRQLVNPAVHAAIESMGERNKVLESKGYVLDYHPDLIDAALNEKGAKFFMDHPNTYDLIAADKIKTARGEAVGLSPHGLIVRNNDNSEHTLPAEGIILATGYETVDLPARWAASGFLDQKSADKIENVSRFGIDAEGEVPGYTTFSGHEHLYFSGIGFYMNRWVARYTALQVVADVRGVRPERYRR